MMNKKSELYFLIISLIARACSSERFYLLNFKPGDTSTVGPNINSSVVFKTNCLKCPTNKGGWRFENNQWMFEESSLSRRCCSLNTVTSPIPEEIPVSKEVHISLVVKLTRCTEYGLNCREKLYIDSNLDNNDVMEFYPRDKNVDKNYTRVFKDVRNLKDFQLSFKALSFHGALKSLQVYIVYCAPVKSLNLVTYPATAIKRPSTGRCIGNAVVASKAVPLRQCKASGESSFQGYCTCNKGFVLTNDTRCSRKYCLKLKKEGYLLVNMSYLKGFKMFQNE